MKDKKISQDEFNDLPDLLREMKGKSSFKTPDNYFSLMQNRVLNQVLEDSSPKLNTSQTWLDIAIEQISTYFKPKYILAMAAIAALIIVSIGIGNQPSASDYEVAFAELSDADYEYFIDTDIEDLENQQLISALNINNEVAVNYAPVSLTHVSDNIMEEIIEEMDDETLNSLDNQ